MTKTVSCLFEGAGPLGATTDAFNAGVGIFGDERLLVPSQVVLADW